MSAANASSVIGFAVLQGADRQTLLERSRITLDRLDDGDGRISMSEYFDLMHAAEDLTDDPAFALRYGTPCTCRTSRCSV